MNKKHLILFGLILFIGAALRLILLTGFSLSNDELSALARLEFNSVSEVIDKGIKPDGHPAGVQLLLYFWTAIFGNGEFSVRLPFALFGIGSVALIYFLAKIWFNTNTAMFTSLSFAILQYPILYSQIARPYSPGLFFVLLFALIWTIYLFKPDFYLYNKKRKILLLIGFVLSALGCVYSHYFAGLMCLIIYLTGFFFFKRTSVFNYLLLGIAVLVGFLPHANIFIGHLKIGGVGGEGGWLPAPQRGYLGSYLFYAFNQSDLIFLLSFGILIGSFVKFRKTLELNKFHAIAICWFIVLYFTGFYYSIFKNPVMQFSILLFAFPFLLVFLFSFIPSDVFNKKNLIVLSVLALTLLGSTILENNYYNKQHFGEFRALAKKTISYSDELGADNVTRTINIHSPFYIDYYMEKLGSDLDYKMHKISEPKHYKELTSIVDASNTTHFLHAWSTINNPPIVEQIITSKYPSVVSRDTFFNSGLVLYSKTTDALFELKKPLYNKEYNFEGEKELKGEYSIINDVVYDGSSSALMDTLNEFGPTFKSIWNKITKEKDVFVQCELWAMVEDTTDLNADLVYSIEANGKSVFWRSTKFKTFITEPGKWTKVYLSYPVPNKLKGLEELKIYVWKPGNHKLYMDNLQVRFTKR
ncbi:MAG: glycosyltransferase family 39 protein [Bacteroidia bacterium]|nr:glycosyltransferase family 39 protein [Bacteroidia bacterium]